jgi:hypothetical protein
MNYLPLQDPHEIRVDEESKLTLHGLLQYYVKLTEKVTMALVSVMSVILGEKYRI